MEGALPVGKLSPEFLARLLKRYISLDDRIVVGPGIGEDATVIDVGPRYLIAKTDPVTFATDQIGWYVVNVNANDIATMGGRPRWFFPALLLPQGRTAETLVEDIFAQIAAACRELGVSFCGGHTEVTYGLDRPIVVGQMLGEVEREALVRPGQVRPGDHVLLTKGIAIEGTAVIGRERSAELERAFSAEFVARCQAFLRHPGLSVVRDALVAASAARIRGMHDPTEGGLATGLREIAIANRIGLLVDRSAILVYPETEQVCRWAGLDPLGVIASGALLIAVAAEDSARVVEALAKENIKAAVVARATEESEGIRLDSQGQTEELPAFARDEIARLFENGMG
jgi:hydrogenase expression/formation protein HypE